MTTDALTRWGREEYYVENRKWRPFCVFNIIFFYENCRIFIAISLKCVSKGPIEKVVRTSPSHYQPIGSQFTHAYIRHLDSMS